MKRALVLSGGGAKGAFQFGALEYIHENIQSKDPDFRFDIIAGVSVGALNGVMLATNQYELLQEIWHTITKSQVYKGSLSPLAGIFRLILGKKSVLSNTPLFQLLQKYVYLKDLTPECDFRIGVVSLISGEYEMLPASTLPTDRELRETVRASTSIPILWTPVKEVRTKSGKTYRQLVDGGVRNVSPLGDVIKDNPDEVIIINCDSIMVPTDEQAGKNMLTIAKRSVADIMVNEIFRSDVQQFQRINKLVRQAEEKGVTLQKPDGTPYVYYRSYYIEPTDEVGDTLDFSRSVLEQRIKQGYAVARDVFES